MAETERWEYTGEWEHVLPDAVGAPTIANGTVIEVPVGFFGDAAGEKDFPWKSTKAEPTPRPEPEVQVVEQAPPPEPPIPAAPVAEHDEFPPIPSTED